MIEQIYFNDLIKEINRRPSISPPLSGSPSSFDHILNEEMGFSKPLERAIIEYLIKTINSIIAKNRSGDTIPSCSNISLFLEVPSQPLPAPTGTVQEPATPLPEAKVKNQKFDDIIQKAATQFGIEPALIKAVISVESRGNPQAVSPAGARGLMQLMPKTAADLGVTDSFDPAQNIQAGTRYLSQLLDRYQGNLKLALAAYNWGMGNLEKNPASLPRETRNYIVQVEKRYQSYLNSSSTA